MLTFTSQLIQRRGDRGRLTRDAVGAVVSANATGAVVVDAAASPSVFADTQATGGRQVHAYERCGSSGGSARCGGAAPRPTGDVVVAKQVATEGLGPSDLEKVETEVRILARFSHANVVSYFCCFLHEETLSIVMEYCDGGTLAEAISAHAERSEHVPTALVATWAKQLGGAVQQSTPTGCSRDIKTANVF